MKLNQLTVVAALLIASAGIAQKDQLKALKKIHDKSALTAKDVAEYNKHVTESEPLLASASESDRAYLTYYKASAPLMALSTPEGKANPAAAMKTMSPSAITNFAVASAAVIDLEKKSGKKVLTDDINTKIDVIKPLLLAQAVKFGDQKKFKEGSDVLYSIYELDKSNPETLYFAASYALDAKDYDTALNYFSELKDLNYTGAGTAYFATSLLDDKETEFGSEAEMNRYVSVLKTHTKPRTAPIPSRRPEILKRTAFILIEQKKYDEAKAVIQQAKSENPDDTSILLTEADLYLKLNEMDKYKNTISQVLQKNPNDAILNYNLGVVTLNSGQFDEAEKYFLRTVELKPDYADAYVNLAAIKLKADAKLVEEMNKLGTSAAENKKYDALKAERNKLFRSTLPYLEKAYEIDPKNEAVLDNLMSVYNYLEMTDKYKALKAQRQ